MSKPSWLRVAAAFSISAMLTGCGANLAQQRAATDLGRLTATPEFERQPDECGKKFEVIPESQVLGVEARSVIKRYERMIEGPVNDRITSCHAYNERLQQLIANPNQPLNSSGQGSP